MTSLRPHTVTYLSRQGTPVDPSGALDLRHNPPTPPDSLESPVEGRRVVEGRVDSDSLLLLLRKPGPADDVGEQVVSGTPRPLCVPEGHAGFSVTSSLKGLRRTTETDRRRPSGGELLGGSVVPGTSGPEIAP